MAHGGREDNANDAETLRELTAEDLKELAYEPANVARRAIATGGDDSRRFPSRGCFGPWS
jgi:hypothetical protein